MLGELIEVLEISVKKNGEIPLTNKHLLNICKMVQGNLEILENQVPYCDDWERR